ncbi:MAG: Abi family protein [Prevotella sp.]|nr:Abi family protein [Prevotella sp.]
MRYKDFEQIISSERMSRYVAACGGDTRKAMTLYRLNLQLSQELFTIISCFEIALRNAINQVLTARLGAEWLKDSIMPGGIFTIRNTHKTYDIINYAYLKLTHEHSYTHTKLIAEMEFGIWKYMFSPAQFNQTGRVLLRAFPNKERSNAEIQYNHSYIFNELDKINTMRNRIAHHEPVCFYLQDPVVDTSHALGIYLKMQRLFAWMGIDSHSLLYGLDHVQQVCRKVNELKTT